MSRTNSKSRLLSSALRQRSGSKSGIRMKEETAIKILGTQCCFWLFLASMGLPVSASADWKTVQSAGIIRFGGDEEGGAPYVFADEADKSKKRGCDVDLVAAIARELKVKSEFVQCNWDKILDGVNRGDFEIGVSGYEYTPVRAATHRASLPYYIYELGLLVATTEPAIADWNGLKVDKPGVGKPRVGVLTASSSAKYVEANFRDSADIRYYEGVTDAMKDVEDGKIDATVQDVPIIQFYVEQQRRFSKLKQVGEKVAPGYYVIFGRKDDDATIDAIDAALRKLQVSGELREIMKRYGLWNAAQDRLPEVWKTWGDKQAGERDSGWTAVKNYLPLLLQAACVTVMLSVIAMPLAMVFGLTITLARLQGHGVILPKILPTGPIVSWLLRAPFTLYVELVRGTPLVFQLYFVYFVLPELGIRLPPFWAGVFGLAINYSAYEAEIFRLGIQAIPKGQLEAALALGMSPWLSIRRIILPQAIRVVIPASANDFIAMFKDTAVCSVITVVELSKRYYIAVQDSGRLIEFVVLTSILYLAMSYPLSLIATWLERRLGSAR